MIVIIVVVGIRMLFVPVIVVIMGVGGHLFVTVIVMIMVMGVRVLVLTMIMVIMIMGIGGHLFVAVIIVIIMIVGVGGDLLVVVVIAVVMVMSAECGPLTHIKQNGLRVLQQFDHHGFACQVFDRTFKPWRKGVTHPDHDIGLIQSARLGWAQSVIVGRRSGGNDQIRRAQIAHHSGDN